MRRLLLVTHRPLDYGGGGATRWRFLRRELPRHGWTVEVVSARPNPTADEFSIDPGHARLAAGRAALMGRVGAVLRPLSHCVGVQPEALAPSAAWAVTGRRAVAAALAEHRPDVVVATGPPPAAYWVTAGLGDRLRTPLVAELRDLWAGNPYYDAGGRALVGIERRALRRSAAIVCVTPQAQQRLAMLHPTLADRIHVLPNGFDPALAALRPAVARESAEPATLVHAGALYGGRSLSALAAALDTPRLRGRVRLELIGPGSTDGLERLGDALATTPPVDWDTAVRRVAVADVALVVFTPGDETAVPGKLYEALALGRPVLALVGPDSAMAALMRSLGRGASAVRWDDPKAIAPALQRLLDTPPPPVPLADLRFYDRSEGAARYAALLEDVAA